MINNRTGAPVEGADFYGREEELEFAWRNLIKGNSLKLSAPRRVGKTSFAKKLLAKAKDEGWNTLEINLEEVRSEEGFIGLFIERLKEAKWWSRNANKFAKPIKVILEKIKPKIEAGGVTLQLDWKESQDKVYEELKSLLNHKEDTLIVIDELTILLANFIQSDPTNGISRVENFLNWLRSFRQKSGTKVRWIFCSSIGIETFVNTYGVSNTINDVAPFKLDAFSEEKAMSFFAELARTNGHQFKDELIKYALNKIEWHIPFFVQILFNSIDKLIQIQGSIINEETIDKAYINLIEESHFNTWDERLRGYASMESDARKLLREISKSEGGLDRQHIVLKLQRDTNDIEVEELKISRLLSTLQTDGYLVVLENHKYVFRSPMIRDFWYNRFIR